LVELYKINLYAAEKKDNIKIIIKLLIEINDKFKIRITSPNKL